LKSPSWWQRGGVALLLLSLAACDSGAGATPTVVAPVTVEPTAVATLSLPPTVAPATAVTLPATIASAPTQASATDTTAPTPSAAPDTAAAVPPATNTVAVVAPTATDAPMVAAPPPKSLPLPALAVGGDLSFQIYGETQEATPLRDMVQTYVGLRPQVRFNLNHVPNLSEYITKLRASFTAGSPPDIFVLPYRYFAQFSAKGALEPLGPWLDKSPMIKAADFYPQAMEPFTVNGTLQCMPLTIAGANVYYNKEMFQKAGVPFPHTGWTWQEFLRAAQAMTKPGQYGLGMEPELENLAPFIWQHGGELVDDPAHPTQMTLNTPATRSAIQYFINLSQAYRVVPSETDMQAEALETRWDANQIGMIIGNRSDTARFRRTKGFTWDVATLPSDVVQAGNLKSEAYCISAKSKNRAAAWDFVQWASSPDAQAQLARTGRTVPTLQSVAGSSAFLDPTQAPAHPQIYLDAIPTLRHVPNTAAWPEIESAFNAELERAFFTSVPLDTALNAITEQGNAALARVNK